VRKMAIIKVYLTPVTWIKAPLVFKDQLKRYIQKGWINYKEPDKIDRAFPRTNEGKAYIPKLWLESALVRASRILNIETRIAREWEIVKKVGELYIPVNYIEIPEQPLVYARTILTSQKQTLEVFEYIDGTFTLEFIVKISDGDLQKFLQLLSIGGELGIMSATKRGYGKFKCEIRDIEEEILKEELERKRRKT